MYVQTSTTYSTHAESEPRSRSFLVLAPTYNLHPRLAYQLGDNKVKNPGAGGSFSSITCECAAIGQRFDDPRVRVCGCVYQSSPMRLGSWTTPFLSNHSNMTEQVDGKPVDFCLRKQGDGGTDCGGPDMCFSGFSYYDRHTHTSNDHELKIKPLHQIPPKQRRWPSVMPWASARRPASSSARTFPRRQCS